MPTEDRLPQSLDKEKDLIWIELFYNSDEVRVLHGPYTSLSNDVPRVGEYLKELFRSEAKQNVPNKMQEWTRLMGGIEELQDMVFTTRDVLHIITARQQPLAGDVIFITSVVFEPNLDIANEVRRKLKEGGELHLQSVRVRHAEENPWQTSEEEQKADSNTSMEHLFETPLDRDIPFTDLLRKYIKANGLALAFGPTIFTRVDKAEAIEEARKLSKWGFVWGGEAAIRDPEYLQGKLVIAPASESNCVMDLVTVAGVSVNEQRFKKLDLSPS